MNSYASFVNSILFTSIKNGLKRPLSTVYGMIKYDHHSAPTKHQFTAIYGYNPYKTTVYIIVLTTLIVALGYKIVVNIRKAVLSYRIKLRHYLQSNVRFIIEWTLDLILRRKTVQKYVCSVVYVFLKTALLTSCLFFHMSLYKW